MTEPALAESREATAWAAGLFEGEGCTTCISFTSGRHRLESVILMADLDRLEAFASATGLGDIRPYTVPSHPLHRRPLFRWHTRGHEHVQALGALLWPWLGERRREQLIKALTCYRANSAGKRMRAA